MVTAQEVAAWRGRNPLRLWRQEQGYTLSIAAAIIGTGITSVQSWEQGSKHPNAESMNKLRRVVRASIEEDWKTWELELRANAGESSTD